jgi:hypothetical protein
MRPTRPGPRARVCMRLASGLHSLGVGPQESPYLRDIPVRTAVPHAWALARFPEGVLLGPPIPRRKR